MYLTTIVYKIYNSTLFIEIASANAAAASLLLPGILSFNIFIFAIYFCRKIYRALCLFFCFVFFNEILYTSLHFVF